MRTPDRSDLTLTPGRVVAPLIVALVFATAAAIAVVSAQAPRFYSDDPIGREPDPKDASSAQPTDISLLYDLSYNLFAVARRTPSNTRAQNINTIEEVPDSSWFANRIGTRDLSMDEIVRGPNTGRPPAPERWVIIREKSSGYSPGFTAEDANGETWFISFDPPGNREGASAAVTIANRIFWALGYNQVETFITAVDPANVTISPKATIRRPSGARTAFARADLDAVFERSARNADGTYRVAAARLLPGKILGGFRYEGTRPDDPNDIVPHEHRRELRALRVFGAWTNLTDMKAGNTLDTLITANGRGVVKHYLQDVGSTFGMGANGPHDWDEGWEYFYQGDTTRKRVLSFGFALSPWQTARYPVFDSVGRFEGDRFDPTTWKPHTPTTAYMEMRADDAFWAARRVMAFSDDQIRALVKTGQFTDAAAEQYLGDVLIKRRDKIGRAYLTAINPVVHPRLDANGSLTFENAAVAAGYVSPSPAYRATWANLNNMTGETSPLGETRSATTTMPAPRGLPSAAGSFVEIEVSADTDAHPSWQHPIRVSFRRTSTGWTLVGLERLPERATGASTGKTQSRPAQ
jgi:hypothetical protein